ANLAGGAPKIFSPNSAVTGVAIAPDRKHLAYTTDDAVFIVGVDGSNPHQVSTPISPPSGSHVALEEPEWSHDGATIYLGFGLYSDTSSLVGGTTLATMPATGGLVTMLAAAQSNCRIITAPKFSPDGTHFTTVDSVCLDDTRDGVWLHTPDGAGDLLAHDTFELAKPLFEDDGSVVAVGLTASATNGLIVIQNAAITGYIQPPAGLSFEAITEPSDGSAAVIATYDGNLLVTTDFVTYTPIVSTGNAVKPTF
ncbi:MAG TPA: hypothetical protein VF403_26780, partial [Kofleriaceae bacterium]